MERERGESLGTLAQPIEVREAPTFSAFPVNATNVPRLVYSVWEGERFMPSRENGEPRTWNDASVACSISDGTAHHFHYTNLEWERVQM